MLTRNIQIRVGEPTAIDRCSECANPFALQTPVAAPLVSTWVCEQCGSVYLAESLAGGNAPHETGARIAPYSLVLQSISSHAQGQRPAIRTRDVERLIQCLTTKAYTGPEKRVQTRYRVAAPVDVIPLSHDFRISGNPVRTVLSNVSCGGAAFVSATRVADRHLLMDFSAAGANLQPAVLQVNRVQPLRAAFVVAGRFLSRVRQAT